MNAAQLLTEIADSLTPGNWCQEDAAVDENGYEVDTLDPHAARRCLLGWIGYVAGDLADDVLLTRQVLADHIYAVLPGPSSDVPSLAIEFWNDEPGRTVDDVKALVRKAAERAARD